MTASTDRARPVSGQTFDAILFDLDGTLIDSTGPTERVEAALPRAAVLELAETDGIVIKAGVRELLGLLPAGSWAIVTSCTRELAAVRMAAAGLSAPGVVVTVDDVAVGKPDPEGFRQAAVRLGVDPAKCLVVEDAPAGLEAAHRAGCATLAVAGTLPAAQLVADTVVGSLADVGMVVTQAGLTVSIG
ncbi:HAD family hydrolase [Pseudarthrobacter sp. P1]|uniref:HAD family hydrolase n=1 Tax=Pseudarthrobacter sp. P1 TaxID=3418418 RepID=UPI003CEDFD9C